MMTGFVVSGDTASLQTMSCPIPGDNEALIRILIAAVCNTDLEIMKGYMGFAGIVGHEFVGIVEQVPDSHSHLLGKRVVGDINLICGDTTGCGTCALGSGCARVCTTGNLL